MKLKPFIAGLQLLALHFKDGDSFHIGAEHDQFYVYATDTPLEPDEVKQLAEWGWFQPELEDDAPYDPEEGWSAFT